MGTKQAITHATLAAAVCLGSSMALTPSEVEAAAAQPNIVVIYADDFAPEADWLWSDPARTPALARFAREGVRFENATAVTSLCSPARASMLTGTYGHKNGVTRNDPSDFDPGTTVAPKLQRAGYHTIYAGKYMNKLRNLAPKPRQVWPFAEGWDDFDVLHTANGKFYDYALWTKQNETRYGTEPSDHSTRVLTKRAAQHILDAPSDKPVFTVLSIYNGHTPNEPLPRFKDHRKCAEVEPWQGPAYNEEDVSDKPLHVQALPLLPADAYDLRVRCEEMMTIDWATQQIRAALRESGRLKDTLFIFTSDNGWNMGDHRVEGKNYPYSHTVILYMLWPKQLKEEPRTIAERVQNVDLAPTFCDLAGCRVKDADGMSLVPLLKGTAPRLARDFVYEEKLHITSRPAYYGLRTTKRYSTDHMWVYTELSTGERELYDRAVDPWQLQNLAADPSQQETVEALHALLHEKVIEPNGVEFIEGDGGSSLPPLRGKDGDG